MNYNIRMKMKFFVKSVLCLVMLTSLCCSCSDDSESWEELDAPTGEVLQRPINFPLSSICQRQCWVTILRKQVLLL